MSAVEIDLADLRKQLNGVAKDLSQLNTDRLLKRCAVLVTNDLKKNMKDGKSPDGTSFKPLKFPRPNGKSSPLWDSGLLARSLGAGKGHVQEISGNTLIVGTNLEYAALHQYGGEVTPKNSKWLAIPVSAEAKRAGGAKHFGKPLSFVPLGRSKAALRETRQAKGKRGGGKATTHFILVKKVTIPPRPFIGFSPKLMNELADEFAKSYAG